MKTLAMTYMSAVFAHFQPTAPASPSPPAAAKMHLSPTLWDSGKMFSCLSLVFMSPHVTVMLTVYWYRVRLLKSKSVAFIIMRKNKSPAGVGFFYKGNLDNFLTSARARSTVHQIGGFFLSSLANLGFTKYQRESPRSYSGVG